VPARAEATQEMPAQLSGGRLLLVEDNAINQKVALTILRRAGHHVDLASNGQQAVDLALANQYDLILMDIQMPILDGIGATRQIRAAGGACTIVPIIAMTANAMHGAREQYLGSGFDDYISKPISASAMLQTIRTLLARPEDGPPAKSAAPAILPKQDDMADGPMIDLHQLTSIQDTVSPAIFVDLVGSFLDGATARIALVEQFAATGDFPALASEAHDLVSTAGNFGARRVSGLARRLESAARRGDAAVIAELIPVLVHTAGDAFTLIRTRVSAPH